MPDNIIQPCKVGLAGCTIQGADLKDSTIGISIFETMCKPYITATLTIKDAGNVINNLQLRGGERVAFSIYDGFQYYNSVQYILSIDPGDPGGENNYRTNMYSIRTASESFFNDRASIVQRADMNIPATAAAQAIHNEYVGGDAPLSVPLQSLGLIATTQGGGYTTSNKKPFTAIKEILERCAYGGFKTGSTVYFRARNEYVMAPLEYLFATMSPQEVFDQKQAWGTNWQDTFNIYNAIIHAATKVDEDKGGKRGGMASIATAASGMTNLFDQALGKEAIMLAGVPAAAIAGGLTGAAGQFVRGRMGGLPNVLQTDSRRQPTSTDQQLNIVAQNMFQAQVKDSVNYFIKVPIQSGFKVTVGKGIQANLLPPIGDLTKENTYNAIGGPMLVADINHECYFDAREVQGTSTMRAVQLSYNH